MISTPGGILRGGEPAQCCGVGSEVRGGVLEKGTIKNGTMKTSGCEVSGRKRKEEKVFDLPVVVVVTES